MDWVWIVAAAWLPVAVVLAVGMGRAIALADRKAPRADAETPDLRVDRPVIRLESSVADVPAPRRHTTGAEQPRCRRRSGHDSPPIPALHTTGSPVGRPPAPHPPRAALPVVRKSAVLARYLHRRHSRG